MKMHANAAVALVSLLLGCAGAAGPQGPAGATGEPGDRGPAGPAGPADVDALELPGPAYYPESLTAAADGSVYVGSVATGQVVRFAPGAAKGETFLAAGALKGVAGVLVDDGMHALFVCAVDPTFQTLGSVRRYDLKSGELVATFSFEGAGANPYFAFPNDLALDAAHRLYVADSFGGKVYVVADVAKDGTLKEWASAPALAPAAAGSFGADGITFDGAGHFYVNNNSSGALVHHAGRGRERRGDRGDHAHPEARPPRRPAAAVGGHAPRRRQRRHAEPRHGTGAHRQRDPARERARCADVGRAGRRGVLGGGGADHDVAPHRGRAAPAVRRAAGRGVLTARGVRTGHRRAPEGSRR